MEAASCVVPCARVVPSEPVTQISGWAVIPLELRLKIFCLAAKEKKTDFAFYSRVCKEWQGNIAALLNLVRLRLFANALAAVQPPAAASALQGTAKRMALQLENSAANHQSAFSHEWMGMIKIIWISPATSEIFHKYHFPDYGWTLVPLELRLKIFCLAAKEKETALAACSQVCREWKVHVGPLLNLARLRRCANALATEHRHRPPASDLLQEASKRMASQLENPNANHQSAFAQEWKGLTKIPLNNYLPWDLFQKYRLSDLRECLEAEKRLLQADNPDSCKDDDLLRLARIYWRAGFYERVEETLLRMYFLNRLFDLFEAKQWDKGIEQAKNRHIYDTEVWAPLLNRFILEKKFSRVFAVLALFRDRGMIQSHLNAIFHMPPEQDQYEGIVKFISDMDREGWYGGSLHLSLAQLLVDAGRGDLVTQLPKVCPFSYKNELYEFFVKWFALNRGGMRLPPDKEVQAVTDHLLKNFFFKAIFFEWVNILVDCQRYRKALDALKRIKPCVDEKKYSETLSKLAAQLGCNRRSVAFESFTYIKRVELLESALKRKEVSFRPKPQPPRPLIPSIKKEHAALAEGKKPPANISKQKAGQKLF